MKDSYSPLPFYGPHETVPDADLQARRGLIPNEEQPLIVKRTPDLRTRHSSGLADILVEFYCRETPGLLDQE